MRCPSCSSEMVWNNDKVRNECGCGYVASPKRAVDQSREDQDDDELDSYRKGVGDE